MSDQPQYAYDPQTHQAYRWIERYQQWEPYDPQADYAAQKSQAVGEALGPLGAFSESALNTFFSGSRGLAKLAPGLAEIGLRYMPDWARPYNAPSDQQRQMVRSGEQVNPIASAAGTAAGALPLATVPGGLGTQTALAGALGGLSALGEDQDPIQGALRAMAVVGSLGLIAKGVGWAGNKIAARMESGRAGAASREAIAAMTPEEQAAVAAGQSPAGLGGAAGADINRLAQRNAMAEIARDRFGYTVSPAYETADPSLRLTEKWMANTPGAADWVSQYTKGNQRILANIGLRAMGDVPVGEINPFVVERWSNELAATFKAAEKSAQSVPRSTLQAAMERSLDAADITPLFSGEAEKISQGYLAKFGNMISARELGAMQQKMGQAAASATARDGAIAADHLWALHDAALDTLRSTMPAAQREAFDIARQQFRLVRVFQHPGVIAPGGEFNLPTLTRQLMRSIKPGSPTLPAIRDFVDGARTLTEISSTVPSTGMVPGNFHGITGAAREAALKTLAPAVRKIYSLAPKSGLFGPPSE